MASAHVPTGQASTAIGNNATATADGSTAVGWYATATGLNSTAVGRYSQAIAEGATAVGRLAVADGIDGVAIGRYSSNASFNNSVALQTPSRLQTTRSMSAAVRSAALPTAISARRVDRRQSTAARSTPS